MYYNKMSIQLSRISSTRRYRCTTISLLIYTSTFFYVFHSCIFDADRLYFFSAYITEEYINELLSMDNSSNIPLIVNKFPKTKELSLSLFEDRKKIFMYLSAMRKYALNLEAIYAE